MRSDEWAGALSWCNIQVWFSHNSGLFLCKPGFPTIQASSCAQHPSNALIQLFVYHLTTWYKFMMDNAFPIQKHSQQHPDFLPTHPYFFWSSRPFLHPLRRLHLGFNIKPINPRLISCKIFMKFAPKYHTHTCCSSSSFIVTLSLIWKTACACAQFSRCSLMINAHS
jgi:hypothetical protein